MTATEFEAIPAVAGAEPRLGTLVMKFGGTSVADPQKIRDVARRLVDARAAGNRVVAVLSAMGHSTDDLVRLAYEVSARPKPRELDMLISVGERISCALAAMAIHDLGAEAISLTGSQAGIVTDTVHGRAKIVDVRARRIHEALDQDRIVLVAGFQGVSTDFDITTLGRGGSDTTAVALAAALGAAVCEIYTDVEGVFTADPRLVPEARKLHAVSYEEMLELAASGAKALISGVTDTREETLYRVEGTTPSRLFAALAEAGVNVDTIVQTSPEIVFSAPADDRDSATDVLDGLDVRWSARDDLGKVSVIGAGMKSHPGVAAKAFATLAEAGIEPEVVTTSPIKISCHIRTDEVETAVAVLHRAFELDAPDAERQHA